MIPSRRIFQSLRTILNIVLPCMWLEKGYGLNFSGGTSKPISKLDRVNAVLEWGFLSRSGRILVPLA